MTRHIRHIVYDVSKIVRSSVASEIVPRPAAGFYAAWKALRICLALLLIQGHNVFSACRGSTKAHFVSGTGFSRLGQHRHGRLLVSSSGVANVSDGSLFVAALRDPAVKRIVLTSPLVDVPPDTWEAVGGNLPIPITRNLTLEGDEADWPLLRLHYVRDVVRLMDTVIWAIRFLFLDGANGDNNYREQGFSFLAPTLPNQESEMQFGPAAMSMRFGFPSKLKLQTVKAVERPAKYPNAKQLVLLNYHYPEVDCRNGSSVPPLQRCWPDGGFVVEMAGNGNRIDPSSDQPVPTNTIFLLQNVTVRSEHPVNITCLTKQQAAPLVCYQETKRQFENVTTSFLDDYRPDPLLRALDGNASSPQVKQTQRQDSAPPAASGAEEDQAPSRAVVVGAVVAGTVVTVSLVALMVAAAARSKRLQEYCKDVGGSRAIMNILSFLTNNFGRSCLQLRSCPGPASQLNITGTAYEDGSGGRGASPATPRNHLPKSEVAAEPGEVQPGEQEEVVGTRPTVVTHLEQAAVVITLDTRPQPNLELRVRLVDPGADAEAGNSSNSPTAGAVTGVVPLHSKEEEVSGSGSGSAGGAPPCTGSSVVELSSVVRGKGTFGRVVEGTYRGQQVAVKLLASDGPWGCSVEAFASSFAQEVQVLSRCYHPNVVRLLAACVESPRLCLVLELMETSLDCLMYGDPTAPPMPLPKVLHIAISIANALAYLHPTITHRDLKPANVLLNDPHSDRPTVKLADFGLSRLRVTVAPTEHPNAGTPAYMAPECFDLQNRQVTHKADMFALGVLLWEMLACERPWPGMSPLEIGLTVAFNGMRLSLDELLASERCPSKLGRLLLACWETDPDRRPAAAEAIKELALILQPQEQQLQPPSLVNPPALQQGQQLRCEQQLARGPQQSNVRAQLTDTIEVDLWGDSSSSNSVPQTGGAARGAAATVA